MVATRLRRVRPQLAAVIALGPLLGVAAVLMFGGWLPGLAVPALILAAGAGYFALHRFRPRRWPHAAAVLGAVSGAYLGLSVPAVAWMTAPLGAVLLGLLGFTVADRARRRVLLPYTAEFADSPVEVPWPARGARGLELLVGADRITLIGSRSRLRSARPTVDFGDVGTIEQVMVARRATLHVPGVGELNVTVTPGPAVRIAVPPGEWILPTDQGRDIARLVARRKELAGEALPAHR
ncbi:hypothetical protein SAMN05192558_10546 [Actinokineospora alba]|uniref:Uncharacterized protein n=1 Tax=Actinokineospora alba TaxID=504798 RepID=A0A1H0MTL0_9PSEU|nr:hypothetical protein C8E96_3984 [Actinokineospora alba]SDH78718.1 hypothetical protein SAMN05421871_10296 [Actinokineospora alba]SDO83470.1 hypothetical protein SAMN05192558_10546 [Actinokineospora alba]